MKTLFIAWQDPTSRQWYPVGRLTKENGRYQFVYTKGAESALSSGLGFSPPTSFPFLRSRYVSEGLFPLFANRVLRESRPEFEKFIEWLSLPQDERNPMAILARSGGRRRTDSFEVFPMPEEDEAGAYNVHFFVHGLRHQAPEAIQRAANLSFGEPLLLVLDIQNPVDPKAIRLRTSEATRNDVYLLGYLPRYLVDDLHAILQNGADSARVSVQKVNLPPAPVHFRLLCSLVAPWPRGFQPCHAPMYQPISEDLETLEIDSVA